jgi:choice-of-anchor B domain-containing protein
MSKLIPCTIAAAILGGIVATLPAQNVTVVKQWKRSGATFFNDCWGYSAPDGREYAIVGESRGIWVLETTGGVVKQLKWWSAPSSTWRSFTNVGPYVYVGTENGTQRGFRVIDFSKPGVPVDLGYVQTTTMTRAHDVASDPDAGFIYFTGSNQGVAIYDVKTTPKNPKFVASWRGNSVHDACIRRGKAYFASGRSYACKILNVTNVKAIKAIGQANTPGGYSHNAWVSEDDKLLCCTDEIARNGVTPHMTVWDISNPASPKKVGDYDNGSSFIAHNVYVIGRTAYMSHYIDGMHVIDLADPTKPTRIARYDTSTVSRGYNGCWGCYPFADSGLIYASDMQNGFFALQVNCGHMNRYGAGTAGTKGLPRARFDGASPKVNASKMRLECENLEPNKSFWVVIGSGAATTTVLGAKIHVNLGTASIVGPITAGANGKASVNAPVPNNGGLGGVKVYLQLVGDRGNGTLISSRGMWAGICK